MSGEERNKPYSGYFNGREHRFALRVYFEDTDTGQIVYHANYLKFMERARSDMLREAGIDQRMALDSGLGVYAVTELAIKYRRPAKLDDDLLVASTVKEVRAASCRIHQRVMRGDEILAEADVVAAFLSPQGKPRRQPQTWVDAFKRLI
ncbi:YbgC/FadM family acyl-CoA thioesterase [Sphingomonas cavernae]|uniref:YbgC/FadM family acyl-CoA thioesterase n=1 Tax=Sphingomonas cavernae TaxID=2320861 RepID=A0A418W7U9_9SPHN|nr:YbgC/FadM family acyl-CoA thioesterase [Sphingomonas cavernae]RJF86078.1 YbgC/FadM family acyl-CoA thioesterase [Sphingomonas cavernae]